MQRIHVIGRKNHGKTQLVVDLVEECTSRGLRVGTVKHTHHRHELDTPGKDSHRHRTAGAAAVGIVSQSMSAVFIPVEQCLEKEDRYASLAAVFSECDVVIVEGDSQAKAPKIEVWRAAVGSEPLAVQDKSILAVITDDPLEIDVPIRPRKDVQLLANWIVESVIGQLPD